MVVCVFSMFASLIYWNLEAYGRLRAPMLVFAYLIVVLIFAFFQATWSLFLLFFSAGLMALTDIMCQFHARTDTAQRMQRQSVGRALWSRVKAVRYLPAMFWLGVIVAALFYMAIYPFLAIAAYVAVVCLSLTYRSDMDIRTDVFWSYGSMSLHKRLVVLLLFRIFALVCLAH